MKLELTNDIFRFTPTEISSFCCRVRHDGSGLLHQERDTRSDALRPNNSVLSLALLRTRPFTSVNVHLVSNTDGRLAWR